MNDTLADNGTISGNGVESLGDLLVDVLHKFEDETDEDDDLDDNYYRDFYKNFLQIIDTAMGQYWDMNQTRGINLNLKYLHNVDTLTETISEKQIESKLFSYQIGIFFMRFSQVFIPEDILEIE